MTFTFTRSPNEGKLNLTLVSVSSSTDVVLKKWQEFQLLSDRRKKPQENVVSSYGRLRAVIKYLMLGWEDTEEEPLSCKTWKFLDQPGHLHR